MNIQEMRDWLKDLTFADVDSEDYFDELTDDEIVEAIDRHYEGGVLAFTAASAEA